MLNITADDLDVKPVVGQMLQVIVGLIFLNEYWLFNFQPLDGKC